MSQSPDFTPIRPANADDAPALARLIAGFRQALAALRGRSPSLDLAAARDELAEYTDKGYPIYVAVGEAGAPVGYLVCRVEEDVVWAESLYVEPAYRRRGIAARLYAEAERLAQKLGGDFPYNWIDPLNEPIIRFLQKRGYNTLNLIELRRLRPGETLNRKIAVGPHEYHVAAK